MLATVVVGVGCATLAGVDEDYGVGGTATGSASTTGTPTATTTGTPGGTTPTGDGGTGGGGAGTPTGSGGGAAAGGTGGSGGGTVQCVGSHTYNAVVADCIDVSSPAPNPDVCETYCGSGNMVISTSEYTFHTPFHAYLRFDIDPVVAQSQLSAISLSVTVSDRSNAQSPESGEIWRVAPFSRSDLFVGRPTAVGLVELAGSQGAVTQSQTVTWSLPTDIVDGNSVYLEMRPLVADDTFYFNTHGATVPRLYVTCP